MRGAKLEAVSAEQVILIAQMKAFGDLRKKMMENKKEVVIVGAGRTPVGSFGGALKDFSASELGAMVVKEAFARAKMDSAQAGQIVFGNVIQ